LTNGKPNFFKYNFGFSNNVYLFESVIDGLSFRTIYLYDGIYIITNGNTLINKVKKLKEIENTDNIYCCFDNDDKGKFFDEIIINDMGNKNIKILKSINKDWNEDLVSELKLK
jgi:5S rRNA maturation endonuclease (ribonuclease M5)